MAALVDVIVSEGLTPDAAAVTERIPIVAPALGDAVGQGLALSLARPGRNITGFANLAMELTSKRLELLRTAFPQITAVSVLMNPRNANSEFALELTEGAARSLEDLRRVETENAAALRALGPAVFSGADGVVVLGDGIFYSFRRDVVALVSATRLPAIYPEREYTDDGGLMAYGTNLPDNFRRAADYVDRSSKAPRLETCRSKSRSSSISLST